MPQKALPYSAFSKVRKLVRSHPGLTANEYTMLNGGVPTSSALFGLVDTGKLGKKMADDGKYRYFATPEEAEEACLDEVNTAIKNKRQESYDIYLDNIKKRPGMRASYYVRKVGYSAATCTKLFKDGLVERCLDRGGCFRYFPDSSTMAEWKENSAQYKEGNKDMGKNKVSMDELDEMIEMQAERNENNQARLEAVMEQIEKMQNSVEKRRRLDKLQIEGKTLEKQLEKAELLLEQLKDQLLS